MPNPRSIELTTQLDRLTIRGLLGEYGGAIEVLIDDGHYNAAARKLREAEKFLI